MLLVYLWGPALRLNSKELLSFMKIFRAACLFPSALASETSWGAKREASVWRTCSAVSLALVLQQTQRRSSHIETQIESNSNSRKIIGGWVHVGARVTFCTAMCSFLLDSQPMSKSFIINTLLLSINATKWDWGELAKPSLLMQRPPQSKPTLTTLRSWRELRKKMTGVGIPGVSHSLPQPRRFGWLPFKPHWHVLSLSNCQPDAPARPPARQRADQPPIISGGGGGDGALPGPPNSWKLPVGNDLCFPEE